MQANQQHLRDTSSSVNQWLGCMPGTTTPRRDPLSSSTRHLTKHILCPTTAQSSHIIASRWYERAQRTKSIMTSPGHAASLEAAMSQSLSIPAGRPNLACCCGRTSCAYLSHNNAALDDLEKDLRTAAQLGQVCSLWNPGCSFICALPCSLDSYL
jgi:hypothetical protein